VLRTPRRGGNKKKRSSATAERAAVPQAARCELRAWRSGSAIIPESGFPIAMVHIVRRCQVSGAVREPEEFTELPIYRLPFTDYHYRETPRHLERYR
jgi:hypothetical protein